MRYRLLHIFLTILVIACVSTFFIASRVGGASQTTASAQQPAQAHSVTSGPLVQDAAKVLAYWTPARMNSARSGDELLAYAKLTRAPAQSGASGIGAPALPQGQSVGATPNANKIPHSSYHLYPYSTVGKVFFTDPKTGLNYVCSGASTNSNNKSVVDTAGHCVVQGGSGGNWYTNWVFCPQYFNGTSPRGCWAARQLWSINFWVSTGSFEDDFVMANQPDRTSPPLGTRLPLPSMAT